jgi:threonine dehydrogenase-like Zn-dependent dehydrogenase
MGDTMKAFVMQKIGEVGFTEKPVPEPGPGDAIVKTTPSLRLIAESNLARPAH